MKNGCKESTFKAIDFRDNFIDRDYEDLYEYEDDYIPPKFSPPTEPLRSDPINYGWVAYLTKDFNRVPDNCKPSLRKFAASDGAKSRARLRRKRQPRGLYEFSMWMTDITISEYAEMRSLRNLKRL